MQRLTYLVAGLLVFIAGILLVSAHGNGDEDDPAHKEIPETAITFDVPPTYYSHVKAIIESHCLGCHTEGQIAGNIDLSNPDTVIKGSSDIAFFTSTHYMPPWMPSQQSLPMQHPRTLTENEIAALVAWSDSGGFLGEPSEYVAPGEIPYEVPQIRADQVLQLDEAYTPDETADDDYRCFAFSPEIDEDKFLTGYELYPDMPEEVHHAIVYLVSRVAKSQVDRKNGQDGKQGWSCYSGTGLSGSSEMIGTWAPGTIPVRYPENTGYLVQPDDILILQIHYNLTIDRKPDHSYVNLQYDANNGTIRRLITEELIAPVEIPCPTGVEGEQCTREFAIQRAADLYGSENRYRPDGLLSDCGQTIEDYADNVGENAITYCDFPVPFNVTAYGAFGHMHELGKSFQLELNPDSDQPVMILDIPSWDFHWQDRYQFAEPLELKRGDILRMTCNWNNNLSEDPRYVVWGEGTQDEMCFGTVMILQP